MWTMLRPAQLGANSEDLAAAVFLDALVIRCVMLPAVLELLGDSTWKLPAWLDRRLPHFNIEGGRPVVDGYAEEPVGSDAEPDDIMVEAAR
jgi:RND superfamily putative drug exporter